MDFFDLLRQRQSVRKFRPEQITKDQLDRILLAANQAPIGSNRREEVHLTVVQDRDVLARLARAAERRYAAMPRHNAIFDKLRPGTINREVPAYDPFYGAPTVIFVSHRRQDLQPGIEYCNVTSPVFSMHLAAQALGLGSVYMWFALESMRMMPELNCVDLLQLPPDFEPLLGLAVGYPAEALQQREEAKRLTVNYR